MLRENYYEILGLPPKANNQDIRKAYTSLALQYHPDKNESEDARDKFEAIQRAYETLIDNHKRSCYDASLYNEAHFSPTPFCSGSARYPDPPGGGTIITGDGWSFAINLNNVSVSKLVFTFAEEVVDEESFMEHVHIKTDPVPETQNETNLRRSSKERETSSRPGKNGAVSGAKGNRGSRANSGRRLPNPPGSSSSPNRMEDAKAQTSHDRAANGGGVTAVTVTPKKDANANHSGNPVSSRTRRRKLPAASGDRMKSTPGSKSLRGITAAAVAAAVISKRQASRTSPKRRQNNHPEAKHNLSPLKLTSESRGSLPFPRPVASKGLVVPGRIGANLDLKPKLYATRNFTGKITGDKNLFQKKSTTFPVRHTLFAVKSRVFSPLSRMGTKPEMAKRKASGSSMKRRKKADGNKRNHNAKMQRKKVVDTE